MPTEQGSADTPSEPTGATAPHAGRGFAGSASEVQAMLNAVPVPIFLRDPSGRYLLVNRAWEQFTGVSRADAIGQMASAVWPDQLARDFARFSARALEEGEFYTQQLVPAADGTERVMWISWVPVQLAHGTAAAGVAMDITEVLAARTDQEWVAALVDSTADGVITTRNGITVSWNAAAEALLGYSAADMIGRPLSSLESGFAEDADIWAEVRSQVRSGQTVRGREVRWLCPDGTTRMIAITATPISGNGLGVSGSSWIVRDVEEQVRHRAELERLARTDDLTGLANRRGFHEQLRAGSTDPTDTALGAVIVLDVDDFSSINDEIGHRGGDEVLRHLAERLRLAVADEDVCSRVGGDEFAVFCPNATPATALATAHRIRERLSVAITSDLVPHIPATIPLRTNVSLGVAALRGRDGLVALSQADTALYQAKTGQRGSVVVFSAELHEALRRRRQLSADLFSAVQHGQFQVMYQPVVRLSDSSIDHVEALLRWDHPDLGSVSPAEFIPLAEATQAIHNIGSWVLRTATNDAAAWQRHTHLTGVGVAVNISGRQLDDPALPSIVEESLTSSGLAADLLTLEITETALVTDLESVLPALTALRATGVGLAIDDFGTGYSSLSYLHRIPSTQIKIDRSITADLTDDPSAASIIDSLTQLAASLDLQVVAEGIERPAQHRLLAALGVELGQGWLFSHAVPPDILAARPLTTPTVAGLTVVQTDGHDAPSSGGGAPVSTGSTAMYHPTEEPASSLTAAYTVDLDRRITAWDAASESVTGYAASDTVGRRCGDGLLVHIDEDGRVLCGQHCPLQAVMDDGQSRSARVFFRHADGRRIPALIRGEPIHGASGKIVGARETFTDDTPHRRRLQDAEMSRASAHTDELTGLPNWRRARIALTAHFARPRQQRHGTIAVHLTHPEDIDPTAEDTLIRTVAATLSGAVRTEDLLACLSRREFLVFTAAATREDLDHRARTVLRIVLATAPQHAGQTLTVQAKVSTTMVDALDDPGDVLVRLRG